jgi:signal transduction histidine kinase/CheY-like chemotaxis protein
MAYRSLQFILSTIKQEAQPNFTLIVLKEIYNDLADCEKSIQYYNLTGNYNYLVPYYDVISTVDSKIDQLYNYNQGNKIREAQIDTITQLIEEKLLIWDKLLMLRNDNKISDALNALSQKLEVSTDSLNMKIAAEQVKPKQDSSYIRIIPSKEKEKKKSNIFKRFFSRRSQPEPQFVIDTTRRDLDLQLFLAKDTTFEIGVDKMLIVDEILRLQQEENKAQKQKAQVEIRLIKKNAFYTNLFNNLVSQIEKQELIHIANKAQEADTLVKTTNIWIIILIIMTAVLLLSVLYIIQRYIKKSNSYQHALLKAKDEALKLSSTREQFMANMSHEIRTPINAIAGFTDQIIKSQLNKEQREQISIIKKSTDHLKHIINDILDFSKLEAGKISFESIPFDPTEVINEAFVLYRLAASEKKIKYTCFVDHELPKIIMGDPLRLKQILLNLLSNAIKFTNEGEVHIEVSCDKRTADQLHLDISVSDTGIGIPPEKIHSVFEEFIQAETNTTRNYGGTGLGLAIVRNLINLQNGTIHVRENKPSGTIFSFSIPYLTGTNEAALRLKQSSVIDISLLKGIRILIADDDEFNCRLIELILKKWKVEFLIVHNGEELIEEYTKTNADVLLVDIRMPRLDGIQSSRTIRSMKDKSKSSVPIIALTATIAKEEIETCKQAGINIVLPKPYTEERLFETICEVLKIHVTYHNPALYETVEEKEDEQIDLQRNDFKNLYHLANNDKAFVKEMLYMFIKTASSDISGLKTAVAEQNWKQVAEYAHKIKAPCKHLDAIILVENLQQIENIARNSHNDNVETDLLKETWHIAEIQLKELLKHVEAYLEKNFAEVS